MKKTFKAFWLALMGVAWLVLMASSCRKAPPEPEPDLPLATQEGKGTIGCYINGVPWIPKPYVSIGIPQFLEVVFDESRDDFFGLNAHKDASFSEHLNMYAVNTSLGANTLIRRNSDSFYNAKSKNNCELSYLDTTKTRVLFITKLDKVKRVISGTFEFTAVNKDRKSVV